MDALNPRVYAIQLPSHLLARPRQPAPFLPEDIHICGNCKQSFTDLRVFLQHKNDCNAFISSATAALLESTSSRVNLQMLSEEPLLQVVINEENQPVIIQSDSHCNEENELDASSNSNTAETIEATSLLQCSDNVQITGSDSKRDIHIDEEDVASLLASQFAKEAVYIPDSPNNGTSGDVYSDNKDSAPETINSSSNNNCNNPSIYFQDSTIETVETVLNINDEVNDNNGAFDYSVEVEVDSNADGDNSSKIVREVKSRTKKESELKKDQPQIFLTRKLIYCDQCNFVTMYSSDLTRHMRKHTGEKPFECTICKQRFSRRDKLQTHLRIHTGDKPYRCQFCSYAAIDSGPLRKHLRTHTDERPFKCQFCSYCSKDTSQLTVHLRKHTGDAPFFCQVEKCGRAFKTNTDLKRHGIVHKKVRQVPCKECDYQASNKLDLLSHIQLTHVRDVLTCDICDMNFKDERKLKAHQLSLHSGQKNRNSSENKKLKYSSREIGVNSSSINSETSSNSKSHSCTFCSYESRTQSGLKQHIRKQHTGCGAVGNGARSQIRPICQKTYQCSFCSVAFVREDSLRSHLKQHQANLTSLESTASSGESTDMNKQINIETVEQSSNVVDSDSFFIENLIDDEYIILK